MYCEMFNDADWLKDTAPEEFVFVHQDVGNDVAKLFGAQSFRNNIITEDQSMKKWHGISGRKLITHRLGLEKFDQENDRALEVPRKYRISS